MTLEEYDALPEPQRKAVRKLCERLKEERKIPFEQFLRECTAPSGIFPYVSHPNWNGMFVGVEPDGHTHT